MKIACWSALALPWLMLLAAQPIDRNKPFPPHHVIGNVYFVGTADLGSYLVTTPEGHILINTDYESTVPQIRNGVTDLGFKFTDIKIILGSHAHGDHMQGDALVKELTAARVMAMQQDVAALKGITPGGKPHPVDRILHDGEEVKLGGTTLTAHLTPGHTKGCTTWSMKATEGSKTYDVVIVCSVGWNAGYLLVNNKDYPQISDDYVRSFAILRKLPCDIFLAAHGGFYDLAGKYARLGKGGPNPFLDHAGYLAYIDEREKSFNAEFARQKALQGRR
jgi:metallo-beta-lactamase class B